MAAKWGDIVDDELGSAPSANRTLSGVIQEVSTGFNIRSLSYWCRHAWLTAVDSRGLDEQRLCSWGCVHTIRVE